MPFSIPMFGARTVGEPLLQLHLNLAVCCVGRITPELLAHHCFACREEIERQPKPRSHVLRISGHGVILLGIEPECSHK